MKIAEGGKVTLSADADLTALQTNVSHQVDTSYPPTSNGEGSPGYNSLQEFTPSYVVWEDTATGACYKATYTNLNNQINLGPKLKVEAVYELCESAISESIEGSMQIEQGSDKGWVWNVRLLQSGQTSSANIELSSYGLPGKWGYKNYSQQAVSESAPLFEDAPFVLRNEEDHNAHQNGGQSKQSQNEVLEKIGGTFKNVKPIAEGSSTYLNARLTLRRNDSGKYVRERLLAIAESGSAITYGLSWTGRGETRILNRNSAHPIVDVQKIKQVDSVDPCIRGNAGGMILQAVAEAAVNNKRTMKAKLTDKQNRQFTMLVGGLLARKPKGMDLTKLSEASEADAPEGGADTLDELVADLYLDAKGIDESVLDAATFAASPNFFKVVSEWLKSVASSPESDKEVEEDPADIAAPDEDAPVSEAAKTTKKVAPKTNSKELSEMQATLARLERSNTENLIGKKIAESKLPEHAKAKIAKDFEPRMEQHLSEADIDSAIREMRSFLGQSGVPNLVKTQDEADKNAKGALNFFTRGLSEAAKKKVASMAGYDAADSKNFTWGSVKDMVMDLDGLRKLGHGFGRDEKGRISEAFSANISTQIIFDALHVVTRAEYVANDELNQWRKVANVSTATDFRANSTEGFGYFAPSAMPDIVNSGDEYAEVALDGAERVPITLKERGGLFSINWRDIVDDKTDFVQSIPRRIGLGLIWKLYKYVFDAYRALPSTNYAPDGLAIASAARNNMGGTTGVRMSAARVLVGRKAMMAQQTLLNAATPLMLKPRYLIHNSDDFTNAYQITTPGAFTPTAVDATYPGPTNTVALASQTLGLENIEVPYWSDGTNYDWLMVADPSYNELYKLYFFNGIEEPQLFQEVQESGESFTAKKMRVRFEHHYTGGFVNTRGFWFEQNS